jgi:hypothetical protein
VGIFFCSVDWKMNGGDDVVVAPEEPLQPLEWKFSQVFGERAAGEEVQEGNCLFLCCSVWFFGLYYVVGSTLLCLD